MIILYVVTIQIIRMVQSLIHDNPLCRNNTYYQNDTVIDSW